MMGIEVMDILWLTCGLVGTALAGVSTLLVMRHRLDGTTWKFPLINIVATTLILLSLLGQFSWTLLAIEIFWLVMSAYAFIMAMKERE